jgi:hypothetical protein
MLKRATGDPAVGGCPPGLQVARACLRAGLPRLGGHLGSDVLNVARVSDAVIERRSLPFVRPDLVQRVAAFAEVGRRLRVIARETDQTPATEEPRIVGTGEWRAAAC